MTDMELAEEIERILVEYHRAVELDDASLLPKIMSRWCDLFFKPGASAIIAALRRGPATEAAQDVVAPWLKGYENHAIRMMKYSQKGRGGIVTDQDEDCARSGTIIMALLRALSTEKALTAFALDNPSPERPPSDEMVLPCEFVVGAGHFHAGVKVDTVQGAVVRLHEHMQTLESELGRLCWHCKSAIWPGEPKKMFNPAPDAASGGIWLAVHEVCPVDPLKAFQERIGLSSAEASKEAK